MKSPWKCPKCSAPALKHGKGGKEACKDPSSDGTCQGFICDCEETDISDEHGRIPDDICENARCYHCGWEGRMPRNVLNPAKLKGWKKKAWDAGWRP